MIKETFDLWETVPGVCEKSPWITAYVPDKRETDGALVVLPGGGYGGLSPSEGNDFAEFFAGRGITVFVCGYRVAPHKFPSQLLDARRAMKFARYHAEKYGLDKNKIYIMGSSAGGHLAALTSTYCKEIPIDKTDEIDKEDFLPNGQILCYPVITLLGKGITDFGTGVNLLGEKLAQMGEELSPNLIAGEGTPKAFIWHTFEDGYVNVLNSVEYVKRLKKINVETELHIFPRGSHGMGLADISPHVAQWKQLLINWLEYNGFFE